MIVSEQNAICSGPPLEQELNATRLTLPAFFLETTARHASRAALIDHSEGQGRVEWSYRELRDHSMAIARGLTAIGIARGEPVGVLMSNSANMIASCFAIGLCGGVATLLSTFSTPSELQQLVARAGCGVLLMEPGVLNKAFLPMLTQADPALKSSQPGQLQSPRFPFLRWLVTTDPTATTPQLGWNDFIARGARVSENIVLARANAITLADPAMLFFSSGSTRQPKGILSSHRAVTLQCRRMQHQQGLPDGIRSWTANGFFWSGNFAMVLGATMNAGGCLVLQRYFDPDQAVDLIARENADFLFAWPHQWSKLIESPNWLKADLKHVRHVDRDSPLAAHPDIQSDWIEPRHCYGNTETFTLVTAYPANTSAEEAHRSHGRILPGNTVKIINPDTRTLCKLGETGEIAVKGPTLMLGYLGIPLDQSLDADGFFCTGDSGWLDADGRLHWSGRLSDVIKTGGANVSPLEVDEVLRAHPAVELCQTVGVAHPTLGEMVVSCVVLRTTPTASESDLRAFVAEQLASYKVPRRVIALSDNEVSLTGNAKIITSELRALAARRLNEDTQPTIPSH